MLTYTQIAQAVTSQLQAKFPTIPVMQEDVTDGSENAANGFKFDRPSFKVLFDSASRDERAYNSLRSTTCRIHFFPTDMYNYSLEFLDTTDGLEAAFALNFVCQDRTLTIAEARSQQIGDTTQTKVLEFDFDLQWYDDPSQPQAQPAYTMGTVDLNIAE